MTSAERKERITLLRRKAELQRKSLKTYNPEGNDFETYFNTLQELDRVERVEACFQDIMTFAKTYFQDAPPPHDLLKKDTPSPPFHRELAAHLRESILSPTENKTAIAAPRSHAKSTLITNVFPLWQIMYADDVNSRYIVIIGDKQDNAKRFLDVIKSEIEDNELLIADFGALKGPTWNALEVVTANSVKLQAAGVGEALRGLRYGSFRPSCIILDDVENDESCSTPERIEKNMSWLDRTALPLGDPKTSKFYLVGTVIHYSSVLNTILTQRADWQAFKYKAVEKFPDRMDLWSTFESLYHDRSEGDDPTESARIARQKAMAFYSEHAAEMNEGAHILWPERMDLLTLMERRATKRLAFNSEFQNQPLDESSKIFHSIQYYDPQQIDIDELTIYGAVDPSMGQTKRADSSAIVTVGRHQKTGIIYVLDVDVKKRHPDRIIADIFSKARTYKYTLFSIETIAFQAFMRDELVKRSTEQGVYLPIREFKSTIKKYNRIIALEPLLSNGIIRISRTQQDLIEQLEYFPKGKADDAIDCLAQVMELAKRSGGGFTFGKL